ncbi:MAG: 3-hydroxyacyl-ACP dehydratase FabZ [Nanoarchaeota archaeon]|nr:3-hydroxyacyl-ACP dehydratase FabZ [Nanoarchaeota archaeon]
MNIKEIMNILPHKPPFLMVDRVLNINPSKDIVAVKNITINESCFQGHFPTEPIFPGMLIVEGMLQTGGLLASQSVKYEGAFDSVFVATVDKVRFRKPVTPGDQLVFRVSLQACSLKLSKYVGKAYVDGDVVASATWTGVIK